MANTQTTVPLFVANQVLTAAQQNTSAGTGVPVFATTVTRDAAFGGSNKALAKGQLAFIEASNIVQYYDGAAWATVGPATAGGLVFIATGTVTAGSSVSFDNCFSATYANYLIKLTHTAGNNPLLRLRAGGTDISAANYDNTGVQVNAGAVSAAGAASQTSWTIGNGAGYGSPTLNLGNPFAATNTSLSLNEYARTDANILQLFSGRYNASTSADGFTILGSSITVTARVYGFANS